MENCEIFLTPLIGLSSYHSWAPLTENLAGEKHLSLIANSNLAQLNRETLKSMSAKLHIHWNKFAFNLLSPLRALRLLNCPSLQICSIKLLNPLYHHKLNLQHLQHGRHETVDRGHETEDRRRETGDKRQETRDRRPETRDGDKRQETREVSLHW